MGFAVINSRKFICILLFVDSYGVRLPSDDKPKNSNLDWYLITRVIEIKEHH